MRIAAAVASVVIATALGAGVPPAHADVEYTYSIRQQGDISGKIYDFARKVKATLRHERGWSLGGNITFRRVESGADMRLVLASPAAVESASPGCSEAWSCRVGPRVLINDVRWRNASDSWGKSLRAYQHYVVNHEVGHFLGMDHRHCPEPGAPAPVMQQQSIDQEGCRSNVWPRMSELRAVARIQDVPEPERSPTVPPPQQNPPAGDHERGNSSPRPSGASQSPGNGRSDQNGESGQNTAAGVVGSSEATGGGAGEDGTVERVQHALPELLLATLAGIAVAGFLGIMTIPLTRRLARRRENSGDGS